MTRQPEFDDPCKCEHPRYAHIDQQDACTYICECARFQVALDYKMITWAVLDAPRESSQMFVSRSVMMEMAELCARKGWLWTGSFMGKEVIIDDALAGHTIRFSSSGNLEGVIFV